MNRLKFATILFAAGLLCLPAKANDAIEEMVEEAKGFLESLSPDLRDKVKFEFKSDKREDWHFVPRERKGVPLKDLNKKQQELLHGLLIAGLSKQGYQKTSKILTLEEVLFDLENKSEMRNPGNFYITIFGEPDDKGTWGWSFEGHHLSLNVTIVNGEYVAGSPNFMGANPATVKDGRRKGLRPLAPEENLGFQLINALDEEQRRTAIFSDTAPREILTGAKKKVEPLEQKGIAFAEMNREQGELLMVLIKEYIYRFRSEIADSDWAKIKKAGLEEIYFAWAGGIEKGQGYYYRVQGPTFLLECDNTQNDANHIHTVWRDFENDFGADLLRNHYKDVPHGR